MSTEPVTPPQQNLPLPKIAFSLLEKAIGFIVFIPALGFWLLFVEFSGTLSVLTFNILPQAILAWGSVFLILFTLKIVIPLITTASLIFLVLSMIQEFSSKSRRPYMPDEKMTKRLAALDGISGLIGLVGTIVLMLAGFFYSIFRSAIKDLRWFLSSTLFWIIVIPLGVHYLTFPDQLDLNINYAKLPNPPLITLVFKNKADLDPLSLTPLNAGDTRTQPVIYLLELTDGILVKDRTTGEVVAVKSDLLAGIINTAATPTPSPSSNPSPAPALSPTP